MDKDYNLRFNLAAKDLQTGLQIQKTLGDYTQQIFIEYQKLTEDFIYKNLPIKILKQMKKRINEELKVRNNATSN